MSKAKPKPPYLLQIANAEQSALMVELFTKAAVQAPQAHILASMWSQVERCRDHFAATDNGK
jgi:hypothetical protein